jgi:adenylyl-sulfate kinase
MSFTVWFTGLPCSGKTTLSRRLYNHLKQCNCQVHLMDGDAIRAQLPRPLGFSKKDRDEHGRRLGALAQTMNDKGTICIVAAITPYAQTREHNRRTLTRYLEVFCSCPVAVAESRDSRGLYAKARSGKISHFTGVSDPYEEPESPEMVICTEQEDIDASLAKILDYLQEHRLIQARPEPPRQQEAESRDISPIS